MSPRLPDEIVTQRLRLRCPVMADARAIFESYTQDPEVCHFMVWKPHDSEAVTREFIASCIDAWKGGLRLPYVIVRRGSDSPIGMIEARIQDTTVDIGYVLAREHWGQGFMPEAIHYFTAKVLEESRFFRVQATCDTENIPSQKALEKSGFNREGCLGRHTVHPNISLEPRACFMYAKYR